MSRQEIIKIINTRVIDPGVSADIATIVYEMTRRLGSEEEQEYFCDRIGEIETYISTLEEHYEMSLKLLERLLGKISDFEDEYSQIPQTPGSRDVAGHCQL